MCHQKAFPRYDEAEQIDTAAIVPDRVKQFGEPRMDPSTVCYTEMYCESQKRNEK